MERQDEKQAGYQGWVILEILGHRRLAGLLGEQLIAGSLFVRIDVPTADGPGATQFYAPSAVYAITPCSEAIARQVAMQNQPQPVQPWELRHLLPQPPPRAATPYQEQDEEQDEDENQDEEDEDDAESTVTAPAFDGYRRSGEESSF